MKRYLSKCCGAETEPCEEFKGDEVGTCLKCKTTWALSKWFLTDDPLEEGWYWMKDMDDAIDVNKIKGRRRWDFERSDWTLFTVELFKFQGPIKPE